MRKILWRVVKALLFRLDAETAHHLIVRMTRALHGRRGRALAFLAGPAPRAPAQRVLGLEFRSRVGLAAGFDKNAEILMSLPALGFGFAEIGTVTPRPQAGNERPRLFRNPAEFALFNRMGFNNLGAALVAQRLKDVRERLPSGFRVGVNIGKNKDTSNEEAAMDYERAAIPFEDLADYLVINVSSPNTPGLRALQTIEMLQPIVERVNGKISSWRGRPPLLLKLAPEVRGEDLRRILSEGARWGIDGWVLTNTLGGAWSEGVSERLSGGWSGLPLTQLSRDMLAEARGMTSLPIVSVGGIMSAEEAVTRRRLGADLIQVYSGWVYGGPAFPGELDRALSKMN